MNPRLTTALADAAFDPRGETAAMPERIAVLPKDPRGFPVPWFVAWLKDGREVQPGHGAPDFRVIGAGKLGQAFNASRCWICGQKLGVHRVFVTGPMCVVNRVTSEPPSHRDCAEFAAKACPFLTKPRMRRNEKDLPEHRSVGGMPIDRNPGAAALYETRDYRPFRTPASNGSAAGMLFQLGPPDRIDWFAQGRRASREEVLASIDSGFPILMEIAVRYDGPAGVEQLLKMRDVAMLYLPSAVPSAEI